jgi:hypothetical protein
MFKKLKTYLAKKLLPYVPLERPIEPPKIEISTLNVEKLSCESRISNDYSVPNDVLKKEIARNLAYELIPYIEFETNIDFNTDYTIYRGTIKIVKER